MRWPELLKELKIAAKEAGSKYRIPITAVTTTLLVVTIAASYWRKPHTRVGDPTTRTGFDNQGNIINGPQVQTKAEPGSEVKIETTHNDYSNNKFYSIFPLKPPSLVSEAVILPDFHFPSSYEAELNEKLSAAVAEKDSSVRYYVIKGISGSGKTTLARAGLKHLQSLSLGLMEQFRSKVYGSPLVFITELNAENSTCWRDSLIKLALNLSGVCDPSKAEIYKSFTNDQIIDQIKIKISALPRWALLVDNLEPRLEKEVVSDLNTINSSKLGIVLVTTENLGFEKGSDWSIQPGEKFKKSEAKDFAMSEAKRFLFESLKYHKFPEDNLKALGSDSELEDLITELQGHFFSLEKCAAYLARVNQSKGPNNYMKWSDYRDLVLRAKHGLKELFGETIHLSLERMLGLSKGDNPNIALWHLLCFCSFLPTERIPQILLKNYLERLPAVKPPAELDALITIMKSYSLAQTHSHLSVLDNNPSLVFHRITQKILREEFWPKLLASEAPFGAWDSANAVAYATVIKSPILLEAVRQAEILTERAKECADERSYSRCLEWIALMEAYLTLNGPLFNEARPPAELRYWQGRFYNELARCCYQVARYSQSANYAGKALEIFVSPSLDRAFALHSYANALGSSDKTDLKIDLLNEARGILEAPETTIEAIRRVLNGRADSSNVHIKKIKRARIIADLAIAYGDKEDQSRKKEYLESAIKLMEGELSHHEKAVLQTMRYNLTNAWRELLDKPEGIYYGEDKVNLDYLITTLKNVLATQFTLYGESSKDDKGQLEIARTHYGLALAYKKAENLEEQKFHLDEAEKKQQSVYGDLPNQDLAITYNEKASYYKTLAKKAAEEGNVFAQREYLELQKKWLERARDTFVTFFKPGTHSNIATVTRSLAKCYEALDFLDEAISAARQAYEIFSVKKGSEHSDSLKAYDKLQKLECKRASQHQAVKWLSSLARYGIFRYKPDMGFEPELPSLRSRMPLV